MIWMFTPQWGIAKDAADEANKIAANEATNVTDEETARDGNEEATKDTADKDGNKSAKATDDISTLGAPSTDSAMRVIATSKACADDHPSTSEAPPSSRYLKVGDHLFVSIDGTSSIGAPTGVEVFDDEVITTAGLEVVDEPRISNSESKEQQLLKAMGDNLQKLQVLYHSRTESLDSRAAVIGATKVDYESIGKRCRFDTLNPFKN